MPKREATAALRIEQRFQLVGCPCPPPYGPKLSERACRRGLGESSRLAGARRAAGGKTAAAVPDRRVGELPCSSFNRSGSTRLKQVVAHHCQSAWMYRWIERYCHRVRVPLVPRTSRRNVGLIGLAQYYAGQRTAPRGVPRIDSKRTMPGPGAQVLRGSIVHSGQNRPEHQCHNSDRLPAPPSWR